ncbi:AI-2E family transporter [Flavilitoribacter nigricans]|uniref:AI-2E family transporter n=1 Tax=Flavilitoribacter nigricans (strain ATCC 23147 / DSM 23189 / NBRC 102662 / NCIMB 1420 / SS-2) TaxID=1122177 RepID=A0A2D0NBB3_FLAN2|nr:AI-2E family transporter [Flavilitoribacter nigricans]PHN05053.1 hypothetical protein CRP01_18690 [Flavilitoribacter nigricans DSM 23189 = NBRC 102662]
MQHFSLSIQRVAYFLLTIFILGILLIEGQSILAPMAFAALFAAMLQPVSAFLESLFKNRIFAIFMAFLMVLLPIVTLVTFFSLQIANVIGNLNGLVDQILDGFETAVIWLGETFGLSQGEIQTSLTENFSTILDAPLNLITTSLSSSTSVMASILICFIYTFFFLLYRSAFKNFMLTQFDQENREEARTVIYQVQKLSQQYFYGLLLVMIILGILNSLGLLLIGIKYPFFWGFLGAILAIIPYIGTALGGIFPFLFSLATTDTWWQPLAVLILYFTIQSIEGNFITPKVVGGSVKINPLAAIVALLVGGAIWGVAGLILALPVVATMRTLFTHFDILKPVSELMSVDIFEKEEVFENEYDEDRYRLITFFQKGRR